MSNNKEKKQGTNVCAKIAELIRDAVEECGCTLWDVEIVKEGGEKSLVVYIDKAEGISLDDCEMVNDAVDPIIEEADPIPDSYYLEISSPGLERELKTEAHINAFVESEVLVKLFAPLAEHEVAAIVGTKQFTAQIKGLSEDGKMIKFAIGEAEFDFERKAIAKLKTIAEF